jgi:putative membrane protein
MDRDLGKGSFRYMLSVLVLNVITLFILYAFVDTTQLLQTPFGNKILAIGVCLFVLELAVFIGWNSVLTNGLKPGILAFCLTFMIAFVAEALGVNYGIIFGNYHYPDLLGPQVVGVPLLVALAWEPILYASFCITDILIPARERQTFIQKMVLFMALSLVAAIATTAWDMMMDPFAVSRGYWVWHDGGPYTPYIAGGVPISNFIGWIITAFACQFVCRIIKDRGPKPRKSIYLSVYGPICLYIMLFIMLFSVSIIMLERTEVAFIGFMCMSPFILAAVGRIPALRRSYELADKSGAAENAA